MLRRPGYLVVLGVIVLLVAFMGTVYGLGHFTTSIDATPALTVEVRSGESLGQATARLHSEGVLRNPGIVRLLAVLRGDSAHIKAGEYLLEGDISPEALLDLLVAGSARFVSLTIPEGFSVAEVGQRIEAMGLGSAAEVERLARDPDFIASLDLPYDPPQPNLEGFILPETYFIHRGVSEGALLRAMVRQFEKQAVPLLDAHAKDVGLSPYEVLTLASIIEKETGLAEERPLIAAVFLNRLRSGMYLGSDPTVIYGLDDFDGNLTRVHLRTRTPYNTYKVRGLPPTPIASPGLSSLRAAVNPADVDYLYFVAKGDGSHHFSSDYASHRKAVWKYQVRPHRKSSS